MPLPLTDEALRAVEKASQILDEPTRKHYLWFKFNKPWVFDSLAMLAVEHGTHAFVCGMRIATELHKLPGDQS